MKTLILSLTILLVITNLPYVRAGNLLAENHLAEYESSKPVLPAIVSGPGSGDALVLDGVNDYAEFGNSFTSQVFTVDMWIKPGSSQVTYANIIDNNHTDNRNWVCQQAGDALNTYGFGVQGVDVGFTLTTDKWQHLALVKGETFLAVYVNGVLQGTAQREGLINFESQSLKLGSWGGGGRFWNGSMDEVRVWDVALTETEIRERMCRKIGPDDSKFSDLHAYYNFDSENEATVADRKADFDGTLIGSPVWQTSGAAIGDASAFTYGGSNLSLAHESGESLTVNNFADSPTGVHVYVVNAAPSLANGISGIGANNRYFGVYHFGASNTFFYQAVYGYGGNPFVNETNETGLTLYKRHDNSEGTWQEVFGTLRFMLNKTMTTFSEGTEFILGSKLAPLPVTLADFKAQLETGNRVKISWVTTEERNASHFVVEKSFDAIEFIPVGQEEAKGNSSSQNAYDLVDDNPEFPKSENGDLYYRLRQFDLDGKITTYRTVVVKNDEAFRSFVYPNPVSGNGFEIKYSGLVGNIVLNDLNEKQITIRIKHSSPGKISVETQRKLLSGIYILSAEVNGKIGKHKVVVE